MPTAAESPRTSGRSSPRVRFGRMTSGPLNSLRNRELSSVELRTLDFEDAPGSTAAGANPSLERAVEDLYVAAEESRLAAGPAGASVRDEVLDISALLHDAGAAIVDDSFLRCFQSAPDEPWNWNLYLAPLWALGVAFRHCILFPLRAALLATAFILFFIAFFGCRLVLRGDRRRSWERGCVKALCQAFVASWTGVVRYHGPRPVPRAGHVWVSNHTSMIDYIILTACSPFAVIMQLHPGWVGFLQTQVLSCLGCLWFNRTEVTDRALVAARMRAHVAASASTPLLIFPEGTCVNNRYCVMFKRGAFDVGAVVCPVAIRYDRVFVDAFWNSKRQSFTAHLAKLMRSWAVVCDVWFLEPQARKPGEAASAFAERVQRLIAARAGLTIAPWDGYLKYYNLGAKHPDLIEKRRALFGEKLRSMLPPPQKAAAPGSGAASPPASGTSTPAGERSGGLSGVLRLRRTAS